MRLSIRAIMRGALWGAPLWKPTPPLCLLPSTGRPMEVARGPRGPQGPVCMAAAGAGSDALLAGLLKLLLVWILGAPPGAPGACASLKPLEKLPELHAAMRAPVRRRGLAEETAKAPAAESRTD